MQPPSHIWGDFFPVHEKSGNRGRHPWNVWKEVKDAFVPLSRKGFGVIFCAAQAVETPSRSSRSVFRLPLRVPRHDDTSRSAIKALINA